MRQPQTAAIQPVEDPAQVRSSVSLVAGIAFTHGDSGFESSKTLGRNSFSHSVDLQAKLFDDWRPENNVLIEGPSEFLRS